MILNSIQWSRLVLCIVFNLINRRLAVLFLEYMPVALRAYIMYFYRMKKIMPIFFCLFCSNVFALDGLQVGVGVSALTGLNVSAGFYNKNLESYLGRHFGTRIDFASLDALKSAVDSAIDSYMRDGKDVGDGVKIDNGGLDSWHASILLDYYPFSGNWRLSAGYAWGKAKLDADIFGETERAPNQRFYFYLAGDHYYYNGNDFGGTATVDWNFHGPYLGTGVDIDIFCGFSLFIDAGVVFTNRAAKLHLDIPHEQLYMYNKETGVWNPITIPALDNDVARATREGNDKLSDLKFFPMLKLGFAYRF